jgi:hypothetical protein
VLGRIALPILLACAGLLVACAVQVDTNAPIIPDEDGGVGSSGIGGDGSGGSAGDGGTGYGGFGGVIGGPPLGGTAGGGGDVGNGNSGSGGSGTMCAAPQKLCNGMCVENGPTVGCALDTCQACPALWNAKSGCADGACTITCNSGYVKEGNVCVAPGSGGSAGAGGSSGGTGGASGASGASGAGGRGGAGGSTGSCVPTSCPSCSVLGPIPCCNAARRCGCTWAPGAYCL